MDRIEPVYPILGKWMQNQREKIGLKQGTLADMLDVSDYTVKQIEAGRAKVLLHIYQSIRDLLDEDKLEDTKEKARLFFSKRIERPAKFVRYNDESLVVMGNHMQPIYTEGATLRQLAERYEVSETLVRKALKRVGVQLREKTKLPETMGDLFEDEEDENAESE